MHIHILALKKGPSPLASPADCLKTLLKAKQSNMTCVMQYSRVFDLFLGILCSEMVFSFHDCRMFLHGLMAPESFMRQQLRRETHGTSSRSLEET